MRQQTPSGYQSTVERPHELYSRPPLITNLSVLPIHGFAKDRRLCRPQIDALKPCDRLAVPDPRGVEACGAEAAVEYYAGKPLRRGRLLAR